MTAAQVHGVQRIRAKALNEVNVGGAVERFDVSDHEFFVSVSGRIRPTAEGTVGAFLGVMYFHFYVGRRGGIKIADVNDKVYRGTKTHARRHPLIYGFPCLAQSLCAAERNRQ